MNTIHLIRPYRIVNGETHRDGDDFWTTLEWNEMTKSYMTEFGYSFSAYNEVTQIYTSYGYPTQFAEQVYGIRILETRLGGLNQCY